MKAPETWVWIRGLARESAHWGDFFDFFKTEFPHAQVAFLDLPGAGDNRHLDPALSLEETVRILRTQLQKRIGNKKIRFFCVSLGAMVGMEWMRQFPEDVEAAVLVNSSSKKHSYFYNRLRLQSYPLFIKALTATDLRKRESAVLDLVSNSPERRKEVLTSWVKIAKARPMKLSKVLKQLVGAARYSPPPRFQPIPTLVLVSLGDRMVEPQCSYDLAKAYGWEVKSHPWGGHDLTLDDPVWVINAIKSWGA